MKSLTAFPEDFEPLVIVTGDRRELPPRTKGDLLAYSVSSTDSMYLPFLRLEPRRPSSPHPMVLSDKQFVTSSESQLRADFGEKNILVIGSPAVNLLARQINQRSPFRFDISEKAQEELAEQERLMDSFDDDEDDLFIYHQCLEGILDVDSILTVFRWQAHDFEVLRATAERIVEGFKATLICRRCLGQPSRPIRYLLHKLDRPGIFDPYYESARGKSIRQSRDYGMISIFPNPFSDSEAYSVIYVAGVHGPGTALGVKMLADKRAFEHHPYGGVYEVKIKQHVAYFDRIQRSKFRWETSPYDESNPPSAPPTRSLQAFLSSPSKRTDAEQREFNGQFKRLLSDLFRQRGIHLQLEEPYTIPLGGGDDFWRSILDYEKECRFVIHDVTNFARGVMVEIGFSYGTGREYFLIWNTEKAPLAEWTPELLEVTHVETLSLSESQTADILKRRIVELVATSNSSNSSGRKNASPAAAQTDPKTAFVYARSIPLVECVRKFTRARSVRCISEDDFSAETRIGKTRAALRSAHYAFIELDDKDLDAFIVLGIAKSTGTLKVLPMRQERYRTADFAWSDKIAHFGLDNVEADLAVELEKMLSL